MDTLNRVYGIQEIRFSRSRRGPSDIAATDGAVFYQYDRAAGWSLGKCVMPDFDARNRREAAALPSGRLPRCYEGYTP